ncbi:aldo/keto reductase [Arhodomonas sp. SL1]|uniref:aldo/keto reductase n=1 Tax=Arhodomonas sp. SL1 TaxID=3425691 RepID=UPI003F883258
MRQHPIPRGSDLRLTRRGFLGLSAAAGALALLGPGGFAARAEEGLIRRAIPASGERIPVIGLGTARTFNVNPADTAAMEPLKAVMARFFEGGGRLVDSSPMYGHAESVVGRLAMELDIADELFMATKVWTRGREEGIAQMERSAERMGVEQLELIQVHNLVALRSHLNTLRRWRREGRVRYIGVTHSRTSAHEELTRIVEKEPIDFVQLNYNIAERNAERRLLPAAADNGVAVLVNEPFEKGTLFRRVRDQLLPEWAGEAGARSWAQFFLKFIVSHPAVTCAIPATSDPEHAADNVAASHGVLPDRELRERMARHFHDL